MNYVFDIDGVLTPHGGVINKSFKKFFLKWMKKKNVSVVSGSQYSRIETVLGNIVPKLDFVYACSGTRGYEDGKLQYSLDTEWPVDLIQHLRFLLLNSDWPIEHRYGNHIEHRETTINFSILGRNADQSSRNAYSEWDTKYSERSYICEYINNQFENIECQIGGAISVDITQKGFGKHLILDHIKGDITFFGDRCYPGGNDYSLSCALKERDQKVYKVKEWEETRKILETING